MNRRDYALKLVAPLLLLLEVGRACAGADSTPSKKTPEPAVRKDLLGDPLPTGVVARMGSGRMRHLIWLQHLNFSPDGKLLISGTDHPDGCFRVWDPATGKLLRRIDIPTKTPSGWYLDLAVPGTERLTVVTGERGDKRNGVVRTLDAISGKEITRKEFQLPAYPSGVVLSPDGKKLAAGMRDGTVRFFDMDGGKELLSISAEGDFFKLAWGPQGKLIAFAVEGVIRVHDSATGAKVRQWKQEGVYVHFLEFSADGRLLLTLAWGNNLDGPLTVWDMVSGKERFREMASRWIHARFSPDSKLLAGSGLYKGLVLLDVATGKTVREFPAPLTTLLAFSPDGRTLATGHGDAISLWDVTTGRPLPGSANPKQSVYNLRFTDGGKRLLGLADQAYAWDVATGKELRQFPSVPRADLRRESLVLSTDESLITARDRQAKKIVVLDTNSRKVVATLAESDEKGLFPEVFCPDNRRLISWGSKGIRIWDVKTGQVLHKLTEELDGYPRSVSPDGKWLAETVIREDVIRLWDLASAQVVKRLPFPRNSLYMAFSPDSRCLAAVGSPNPKSEKTLFRIWDIPKGKERLSWEGPAWARPLAFSHDGRTLASGGGDYVLRL
jgi:WD40 repeat protein